MAHPHEYIGTGANPPEGTADVSYEVSAQANPFPAQVGTEHVPGRNTEVEITVTHRYITDDGLASEDADGNPVAARVHTVTSTTSNPQPHIEYGRIS
jgi:hypothetical protein